MVGLAELSPTWMRAGLFGQNVATCLAGCSTFGTIELVPRGVAVGSSRGMCSVQYLVLDAAQSHSPWQCTPWSVDCGAGQHTHPCSKGPLISLFDSNEHQRGFYPTKA